MNHPYPGILITFEGIDGAGKTVLLERMAEWLKEQGIQTFVTKEPGGTHIGRMLKKVLLEEEKECDPRVEFLLFAADRAEHFARLIIPELQKGSVVLSDRMADSSLAYQGFGRGLNKELITQVNKWAMHDLAPDLTYYVHVPYEIALERRLSRPGTCHTLEREEKQFWEQVILGYQHLADHHSRFATLDGTGSRDTVFTGAQKHFHRLLKLKPEVARDGTRTLPGQHRAD
jgi:dTMP kinase